ncbi:hypothetical protein J6590_009328 [Homalodisca vitripennis]|nr:hypothetical protein J6590_009328 [Homalodisca vitripennis]
MEYVTQNSTMNETDSVQQIIDQKRAECNEILNFTLSQPSSDEPYCPGVFDGWSCWPDTAAGHTAYTDCPEFITGFDPLRKAHKICTSNGTWYKHPESGLVWSNYTTCVNVDDLYVSMVCVE